MGLAPFSKEIMRLEVFYNRKKIINVLSPDLMVLKLQFWLIRIRPHNSNSDSRVIWGFG